MKNIIDIKHNLLGVILFIAALNPQQVLSQNTLPVNSNLLIEYGISPKVLDAALSSTLQKGAFRQYVHVQRQELGKTDNVSFQMIYDPAYKDGIDIRVLYEPDSLSIVKSKDLLGKNTRNKRISPRTGSSAGS